MSSLSSRARAVVILFWILAFVTLPIWIAARHVGWDVSIYQSSIHSLHTGHNPYTDAISVKQIFSRDPSVNHDASKTFRYIYCPITLPLLLLIAAFPLWFSGTLYWLLYIVSALSFVWVGLQAAQPTERPYFLFLAPAALFFPGLLHHDTVLSGNIAFILYALVLAGAVLGWRRGRWHFCYLAILLASCFKPPLLTLLAIPLLSGRRQGLPTGITAAAGIALFALQRLFYPSLFHQFLQALELQFSYNRDFGCSPAGLFSDLLFSHGIPYSPAATIVYLVYAIPVVAVLFYLSRQFFAARVSLQQWFPVLLVGTILLNPRIMQYDVVTLTLPLALIAWRFLLRFNPPTRAVIISSLLFVAANIFALQTPNTWKLAEGTLLILFFAAGSWNLLQSPAHTFPDQVQASARQSSNH